MRASLFALLLLMSAPASAAPLSVEECKLLQGPFSNMVTAMGELEAAIRNLVMDEMVKREDARIAAQAQALSEARAKLLPALEDYNRSLKDFTDRVAGCAQ
jgi:hypothetical protein